ncbi:MAG: TonB-dependent siderophore receptor [Acetobacteraceae bacterium]
MRPADLQPSLSQGALGASLAVALFAGFDFDARAQQPAPAPPATAPAPGAPPGVLPEVKIEGLGTSENTLRNSTGLSRLPGPIQSLPQTIDVIPQEIIRQQNATTLEQTLRNVPGITSSVGEGGGGVQGDQLRIRGFNAQNDIYVDGLRDFGTYSRDTFNYDEVEVLLGPAGLTFGPGSVGGVVNVITKTPHLGNRYSGIVTGGAGPLARATFDINQQIGPTSAIRLNILGENRAGIPGRDGQDGIRWGVAPSIALGLGTPVTFTFEYMHYQYDQATDTGVPVLTPPGGTMGKPATEFGLNRNNWYGTRNDRDRTAVDRFTARLKYEATDWLTLYNDTRFTYQERDFAYTILSCTGTCLTSFFSRVGVPMYTVGNGPSSPYDQRTWGVQNIASGQARFMTGPLRHEVNFGVDTWYQSNDRYSTLYDPARPGGNFLAPNDAENSYRFFASNANNATRKTDNTSVGVFAVDRVWFIPEVSLIAGFRWNRFTTDYTQFGPTTAPLVANAGSSFVDPRAALVFEPTPNQTYYVSYATSATPPGANFTTLPGQATVLNSALEPERNSLYEVGAKWSVMDNLGLTATLYRIEKSNAQEVDPLTGTIVSSGDKQLNQGLELGATGRLTDQWSVTARYTWMDSKIQESLTPANVNKRVQFVPKHAAALWTTYEMFPEQPYNLTVGGGITFRSQVFLNAANNQEVPSNFTLDAMVSHRLNENLVVQVNAYNLTNQLNYNTLFGGRVVPAAGRTVTALLSASF